MKRCAQPAAAASATLSRQPDPCVRSVQYRRHRAGTREPWRGEGEHEHEREREGEHEHERERVAECERVDEREREGEGVPSGVRVSVPPRVRP